MGVFQSQFGAVLSSTLNFEPCDSSSRLELLYNISLQSTSKIPASGWLDSFKKPEEEGSVLKL